MATNNSINLKNAGLAKYDGAGTFSAETTTQYNILVGGASNGITSVAPSATSGIPVVSQGSSANPTFGTAVVSGGGTGVTSATPYAVLCGGTTSTSALQSIASVGTSGQVLTSNGAGALPTFQTAATGAISWLSNSGVFFASANKGYYLTGASTALLPVSISDGSVIIFFLRTGSTCTILANTGQVIVSGTNITEIGGTMTSSTFGNCVTLVYSSTYSTWSVTNIIGSWTLSAITPLSISNRYIWIDGSDPLGTGTPPTNGTNVLPVDKFGVATITQATTSQRPIYYSNQQNGLGTLYANDGVSTNLDVTAANFGNDVTMFLLTTPSTTTNSYIISGSDGGTGAPAFLSGYSSTAYEWYTGSDRYTLASSASGYNLLTSAQTTTGTNTKLYYNGGLVNSYSYVQSISSYYLKKIFQSGLGGNYFKGYVAELIIYTKILSANELIAMNLYFANKWGLSISP